MKQILRVFLIFLFTNASLAASPTSFTYEGVLTDSNGTPVDLNGQTITFSIVDSSNCVIYQETSNSSGDSNGMISHAVGTGSVSYGTFSSSLFNSTQTGSGACTVSSTATRYLKVSIASPAITATVNITSVPYALEATAVGGYPANSILRTDNSVASVTPLNNSDYTKLLNLISGSSTLYVQQASPSFSSQPTYSGTPSAPNDLTNKSYVDSVVGGVLPDIITAGTFTKVVTDAKGRITSGTSLVEADVPHLTSAGKVDGGAINAGTIGGSASMNTTGSVTAASVSSTSDSTNNLIVYNAGNTNYVKFTANPSGNLTFVLPKNYGSSGQVLSTDGAGNMSWATSAASPGDASFAAKGVIQADTDAATSGLAFSGSGVLKVNAGTGANQIVKLDAASKLPAVDGSQLTNLSTANLSAGTLPISRGGTNSATALNNNRIMVSAGGAIVESAALTNGQVLIGSTGAAPVAATLGSNNGVSISSGAGTISISTNATSANTSGAIVSRDASGNFSAGAITMGSAVLKGSGGGTLTFTVPTSFVPYSLAWPSADGSSGQFLKTDGAGNLTWGTASSPGDATYGAKGIVQFNTDAATSGISVSSGVATVNSGTGANQIVKLDAASKLPAVDASALTNLNANNISSGTLPISRGGTGASTKTPAFDALSPNTTKGDLIVFNGTNNIRLPRGSDGQVLTTDSAQAEGVKWSNASAGTVISVTGGTGLTGGTITTAGTLAVNVGTGANQIVQMTAASKLPGVDGSLLTSLSASQISSGTLPVSRGGTGASSFAANNLVGTNGTGSALQAVTCAQNQVLSFDASGNYGCYNLSTLAGGTYFANGGNSFAAAATLGTNDNNTLSFKTNNSNRMTIDTAGNVGIAIASPTTKLTVNGTVKIADGGESCSIGADGGMVRYNGGNLQFCNGTAWQTLGVSGAGLTNLNGLTGSTQSFVTSTAGTDFVISSSGSTHTFAIPNASSSSRGLLTSTDWSTFNNKLGTSISFSGDVSGAYNATSVDKIKGISLSISSLSAGNFLKYNGSAWTNANLGSNDVTGALGYTPVNRAGDTISGALNLSGNDLKNTGNIEMASSKNFLISNNSSDPAGLSAADKGRFWFNSSTNQLKYYDGSSIQALGVAGAGITNFNGSTVSSQSFATPGTSGTAPTWSTNAGTGVHTLNVPMASASGVTAGLLSKTDYDAFNSKLGTTTSHSGDVSGTYNAMSVDKIKGAPLSMTSLSPGHFLKYNGSAWVNSGLGSSDITGALGYTPVNRSGDTMSGALNMNGQNVMNVGILSLKGSTSGTLTMAVPGTVASYTLTWPGAAGAANQVLSTDASGNLSWATVASAATTFSNGGNSFGGTATLGTNDANSLGFETSNTTRMTIDSSGNVGIGTSTPGALLDVKGEIRMSGATSGYAGFKSPATGPSVTWTLPTADGTFGQYLKTDGSGNLNWASISSAAITSLNGSTVTAQSFATPGSTGLAPNWSTNIGSGVHTLNIPLASSSGVTAGLLSKIDYDTFNSKLGTLTPFSGDISGFYNSISVDKIKGAALSMSSLAPTNFLKYNGSAWINANLDTSDIATGTLPVSRGGTGNGGLSVAAGGVIYTDGSKMVNAGSGTAGNVLVSNGSLAPTWGGTSAVTIAAGGTNQNVVLSPTGTGVVSTAAPVNITNPSASINYNTGALVVGGGLGVSGSIYANSAISAGTTLFAPTSVTSPVVYGGSATGGSLKLDSTSNVSKGTIYINPSGGSVGIGSTVAPWGLFDVTSSSMTKVFHKNFSASPTNFIQFVTARGSEGTPAYPQAGDSMGDISAVDGKTPTASAGISIDASEAHSSTAQGMDLKFRTILNGTTTGNVNMILTNDGRLGLGTTTPISTFDVVGDTQMEGSTWIQNNTASTRLGVSNFRADLYGAPAIFFGPKWNNASMPAGQSVGELTFTDPVLSWAPRAQIKALTSEPWGSTTHGTDLLFYTSALGNSAYAERIRIKDSGKVGIGTSSPSEMLHVVGNLRVQGTTDCTLGNGAGGTNCSSDIRLKEHVQDIQDPLAKILNLRGVEFDWNEKSQSPGKHAIGVIAQEVEKVFPTAVIEDPSSGFKKVDYAVLVAPVIQALKELNQRVKEIFTLTQNQSREISSIQSQAAAEKAAQDIEIQKLKQENAEMKSRLEKLEKALQSPNK